MKPIPNDHIFHRPDRVIQHRFPDAGRADLYVLTAVFNSPRFRTRWKLYQDFAKRVKQHPGTILCVADIALHKRDFVVGKDDPIQPDILLQLETDSEIWFKENALNLLVARLPLEAQYFAIIDADVAFARDDWANETVQKLQHFDVVQMWSHAQDLGPNHEPLSMHHSFVYSWYEKDPVQGPGYYYAPPGKVGQFYWHPGWAWGWRREAFDWVGRFLDHGILGAADNHMAKALIGDAANSVHPEITGPYRGRIMVWQERALRYIQKNIGYVPGLLYHYFHGSKRGRKYWDRWKILIETKFNPDTDLKYDWQGLHQLVVENQRQERLRDLERAYFHSRDEDATTD